MIYIVISTLLLFSLSSLDAMRGEPRWRHRIHDGRNTPLEQLLTYLHDKQIAGGQLSVAQVQAFFDAGIDVNDQVLINIPRTDTIEMLTVGEWMKNYSGLPAPIKACCDHDPLVIRYIKERRYDVAYACITRCTARVHDAKGRLPLYYAIRCPIDQASCTALVSKLLEVGADPRTCGDNNALPPIGVAAFLHRSYIIELLCAYGASIDQKCLRGASALQMSFVPLDHLSPDQKDNAAYIRTHAGNAQATQTLLRTLALQQQRADDAFKNDFFAHIDTD